jgi:hypothetical protein
MVLLYKAGMTYDALERRYYMYSRSTIHRTVSYALANGEVQQVEPHGRNDRRGLTAAEKAFIADLWHEDCSLYDDEVLTKLQVRFPRVCSLGLIQTYKEQAGLTRKVVSTPPCTPPPASR